jgi:hypothetical protein
MDWVHVAWHGNHWRVLMTYIKGQSSWSAEQPFLLEKGSAPWYELLNGENQSSSLTKWEIWVQVTEKKSLTTIIAVKQSHSSMTYNLLQAFVSEHLTVRNDAELLHSGLQRISAFLKRSCKNVPISFTMPVRSTCRNLMTGVRLHVKFDDCKFHHGLSTYSIWG